MRWESSSNNETRWCRKRGLLNKTTNVQSKQSHPQKWDDRSKWPGHQSRGRIARERSRTEILAPVKRNGQTHPGWHHLRALPAPDEGVVRPEQSFHAEQHVQHHVAAAPVCKAEGRCTQEVNTRRQEVRVRVSVTALKRATRCSIQG